MNQVSKLGLAGLVILLVAGAVVATLGRSGGASTLPETSAAEKAYEHYKKTGTWSVDSLAALPASQARILEDGVVTAAEYHQSGNALVSCLNEKGFTAELHTGAAHSVTVRDDTWKSPTPPNDTEHERMDTAVDECMEAETAYVELTWEQQLIGGADPEQVVAALDCVQGYPELAAHSYNPGVLLQKGLEMYGDSAVTECLAEVVGDGSAEE